MMKPLIGPWRRVCLLGCLLAANWSSLASAQEKPAAPAGAPVAAAAGVSSPEAKQGFADAAAFQNNGAFDLAVEEWEKFLKTYAQDPLAPKGQHYLGVCLLQLKQYEKAAAAFQDVITKHPKFEMLEDTYLNLASCQYSLAAGGKADFYPQAAATYAALAKAYPQGKYADEAFYYQGEALYAGGKKAEAAAAYAELVKSYEKSKRRSDGLYALGATLEELGKYPDAGAAYTLFLKEFPASPLVNEVRLRQAETVLQAGNFADAEKMFAAVAAVKDFPNVDQALFRQAYCLAKLNKFAEASVLYGKMVVDFPKSANLAEATMATGRCLYRADNLDAAAAWLAKAMEAKNKDLAEAAHWRCRIFLRQKKFTEAADQAASALAAGGDSPFLVNLQMDQADAWYELPEKRAAAQAQYAKIATDHPKNEVAPQALYNAAYTSLDLKKHDEALKLATAFIAAYPQDKLLPDVKVVAAECYLLLKKFTEADQTYQDLLKTTPQHADVDGWRLRLGLSAYLQKKYAESIALLSPVVPNLKNPASAAEAQFLIGASNFYTDKFAEAEKSLAAALAASPTWRQADETLLLLARAQRKLNKAKEAKAALAKLVAEFPASSHLDQAHYRLGEISFAADEFPAAVTEYALVASKWPDSPFTPYAQFGAGWSQMKLKQFPESIASFTALLTKSPQHALAADALLGRAMSKRQAGDQQGAIVDLDLFLKSATDPEKKADATYERGLAQVALKDLAGAAATLDGLLKTSPTYAGADKVIYELAWALKGQEKHADALPLFARLAKDFPASPLAAEAWFHVAEDQYEKKEYAEAAKSYAQAAEKKPAADLGEKIAHKLGWSYFQQKQYADALKNFADQAARFGQGPLAADGVFMKAESLYRQDNFKDAYPVYLEAAKTKPSTPAIGVLTLLHGGQSASQLKQWPDALALLGQIPTKFPETPLLPETLYELAWAKQNAGQVDAAIKDYEAAATKARDQVGARARFMLGEVYFEKKQHNEAIREFQRAMFGYGGEAASAETKNWQAKAGYEAGRCAEVQIAGAADAAAKRKFISDAIRFYTYAAEKHPQHAVAAEAKKRLELLGKL